jgi:DNA invertase Pin-like site-specific DNA recombinase
MNNKVRTVPVKLRPEFTGRLVGYARVSTNDQDLSMQISALRRAGVHDDNIWSEHVSGVKAKRPQRDMALLDARKGDVFIVYKLDRLGRSFRELLEMTDDMERRGIGFRSLTEGFDTTKPAGKLLFHMLGALAEFERGLIAERTRDGMAEAKRQGKRLGAPLWFTKERQDEFAKRFMAGETVAQIAESWGRTPNMIRTKFKGAMLRKMRMRRARQQN